MRIYSGCRSGMIAAVTMRLLYQISRELRHSFVSLLSASGVRIEDISRLVGHSGTAVTEKVYRHQLHAVLNDGAIAMDDIFPKRDAG